MSGGWFDGRASWVCNRRNSRGRGARAQTRRRLVTEIVAEKNTNTHDDGRTKHQTRRAHAQDGQQSKQSRRLKRRGCAQRAHV